MLNKLGCYPRPLRPAWNDDSDDDDHEWDFSKSVFAGYIPDSEDLLAK